jgi:hypothetical protein
MIKIATTLFLHYSISNRDNEIATDVVFGMVDVDGATIAPTPAKDPEDNTSPLVATIMFAAPPPAKDLEDDVAPLVP